MNISISTHQTFINLVSLYREVIYPSANVKKMRLFVFLYDFFTRKNCGILENTAFNIKARTHWGDGRSTRLSRYLGLQITFL